MEMVSTVETCKSPSSRLLKYEAGKIRKFSLTLDAQMFESPGMSSPAAPKIGDAFEGNVWKLKFFKANDDVTDLKE